MSAQSRQTIRRAHKILGVVVGIQLLIWTASGLFFTIFPIEQIRGEHLVDKSLSAAPPLHGAELLNPQQFVGESVDQIVLRRGTSGPVYEFTFDNQPFVVDAVTGRQLTPLEAQAAANLATLYWKGDGEIASVELVETPPREAGSSRPLWRVEFQGDDRATLWIDPQRARLKAVRTTNWRIFDVLWRFHIMDITGEDRFDTWWMRIAAFLGLTTVLFGFALLIDRARQGRLLK